MRQTLKIYLEPTTTLEELVEEVGKVIGYPILDFETDRYDEYPAYEIDFDSVHIHLIGVPPDLDQLIDMFPEEFGPGEKANFHQLYFHFDELPISIDNQLSINYKTITEFGKNMIKKLQNKGFELSVAFLPEYLND